MQHNDTEQVALSADVILALNKSGPAILITRDRAEELAAELAQLRIAAIAARARTSFDIDTGDFDRALAVAGTEA